MEGIPGLNDLLRIKSGGPQLTLGASWIKPEGVPDASEEFRLDVHLPTPLSVHLGRGVTTDPIALHIQTHEPLSVVITGGVQVSAAGSQKPLDFEMSLGIIDGKEGPEVIFSADMNGFWVNPFGLKGVSIGDLLLNLDINLPIFLDTGVPKAFGFGGKVAVGKSYVELEAQISEDPSSKRRSSS